MCFCKRELQVSRSIESNTPKRNKTIKNMVGKTEWSLHVPLPTFTLHWVLMNLLIDFWRHFLPSLRNHNLAVFCYYRKLNLARLHLTFYSNRSTVVSVRADQMEGFLLCRLNNCEINSEITGLKQHFPCL